MAALDPFEILKNFDILSDDVVVSRKIAALVLGTSERTLHRHPPIPPIQLSARRVGYRVGTIRSFVRGGTP